MARNIKSFNIFGYASLFYKFILFGFISVLFTPNFSLADNAEELKDIREDIRDLKREKSRLERDKNRTSNDERKRRLEAKIAARENQIEALKGEEEDIKDEIREERREKRRSETAGGFGGSQQSSAQMIGIGASVMLQFAQMYTQNQTAQYQSTQNANYGFPSAVSGYGSAGYGGASGYGGAAGYGAAGYGGYGGFQAGIQPGYSGYSIYGSPSWQGGFLQQTQTPMMLNPNMYMNSSVNPLYSPTFGSSGAGFR